MQKHPKTSIPAGLAEDRNRRSGGPEKDERGDGFLRRWKRSEGPEGEDRELQREVRGAERDRELRTETDGRYRERSQEADLETDTQSPSQAHQETREAAGTFPTGPHGGAGL